MVRGVSASPKARLSYSKLNNVFQERLNEAMVELTTALNVCLSCSTCLRLRLIFSLALSLCVWQAINAHNTNLAAVNEMWSSYMKNMRFNLEREDALEPPK